MKITAIVLSLWGLLLAGGASRLAAQSAVDHLQAGDRFFARFDDAQALAEYEQAARLDPDSYEALWKTAQAYMNVGDRLSHRDKNAEATRLRYFQTSEKYLRDAVRLNPNDSRVHFMLSAVLGREVPSLGRREQIALAYKIKTEIDKALALDPENDLAWHALAYWNRTLAEVGGAVRFIGSIIYGKIPKGSYEEAVKYFQRAIALNPEYCNHHIELARTYLDLKRKDQAAREYRVAMACPDLTSQCAHFKERARRELAKLDLPGDVTFGPVTERLGSKSGR
jgi:Tfp pilus assembly protein PilF